VKRSAAIVLILGACSVALGIERFPPPDLGPDYKSPVTNEPAARFFGMQYIDAAVLAGAIILASYLALRARSRRGLLMLAVFSVAYFGFYRRGCICPVGALQNVSLALGDSGYVIAGASVIFLLLPLILTLLFGRSFCSSVCPLGAVQETVLLKPLRVPMWLEYALGILPFAYLAGAVLLSFTGSMFLICRYDPFVSIFRFSGEITILVITGVMLVLCMFVGRAYCRFLCPLGAVFRVLSPLAWRHTTITPERCIECRMCQNSCPYNAIRPSAKALPKGRYQGKGMLAGLLAASPVIIFLAALAGWGMSAPLARTHERVRLAERMFLEETGVIAEKSIETQIVRNAGGKPADLYAQAAVIRERFATGGWLAGGFVGLAVAGRLVQLSVRRRRKGWEPSRSACFSCGRCFRSCPIELERLRKLGKLPALARPAVQEQPDDDLTEIAPPATPSRSTTEVKVTR
jgi:NosR/NirI family transcriptional regulator, nitrous oxide reductase regulator